MIRKKPITPEAAHLRMADICARAEHCEAEIAEKLRKLQLPPADINKIITDLIDQRFIDNARYAKAFARDKVRFSGWGRNKIRMALAIKKINHDDIADALEQIPADDYAEALTRAVKAKAKSIDINEYADRNKLLRSIIAKGFEPNLIIKEFAKLKET